METYAIDIETDTTVNGLDPRVSAIVNVAVAMPAGTVVLHAADAGEAALIVALDNLICKLPAGILATWNGEAFDLPFIAYRAAVHGLTIRLDGAGWAGHSHFDGLLAYRASGLRASFPHLRMGLKPLARWFGLDPVEADRSMIHAMDRATIDAYVASDAEITRELVRKLQRAGS